MQDLKAILKVKTVAPLSAFIGKKQASWGNGMSADALARILRVDAGEDPASIISLLSTVRERVVVEHERLAFDYFGLLGQYRRYLRRIREKTNDKIISLEKKEKMSSGGEEIR